MMTPEEVDQIDAEIVAELPELLERAKRRQKALAESSVSGQLRRAIRASSLRLTEVCRATEITRRQLADFMTGDSPLPSTAVDRLAALVHHQLTPAE
jgi:hypothetical protein